METAIVNAANSPIRGSTPAMIENEIASGISARATTSPASTSVRSMAGERSALRTVGAGVGDWVRAGEVGIVLSGGGRRATYRYVRVDSESSTPGSTRV